MRLIVRCRGIINTGPDDYRVTLTPAMFGELLKSAKDALEGKVPNVEERAATQLPMHAGNMLLVRLNQDGLKLFTPQKLYLKIFEAWKNGFFQRYGTGTVQQTIRQEAIKELPSDGFGNLAPFVDIWSSSQYDGPLRHGDILMQRISGTRENLGRPFFVECAQPLVLRGA